MWGVLGDISKTRPNIVLIMIDTLRADKLGAYGHGGGASPEIDTIAKKGVVFERTIAQSSWTRASVSSLVTSQYPRSLGVLREQWDPLPLEATTLAEVLKENGYRTVGLTANPHLNHTFNHHQGFDVYVDSNVLFPWMKNEEGKAKATKATRLPRAADIFSRALEEAKASDGKPTYIQTLIMEVHGSWKVPKNKIKPEFLAHDNPRYLQVIAEASAEVGRFVDQLLKIPGWENTVIVITADHGEGLDDHPQVAKSSHHGNLLYESHVRIPMIIYNPKDSRWQGKRISRSIRGLDMMPTLLDYVGLSCPKECAGTSLMPLIDSGKPVLNLPEYFVTETNWRNVNKVAIYSEDFKYIENRDSWQGVPAAELQSIGGKENGAVTDKSGVEKDLMAKKRAFLIDWEARYPLHQSKQEETHQPSPQEVEQLRSLGYLK